MRGRSTLRLGASALVTVLFAALSVHGQTAIWTGGGTNQNYTNPTNWLGGTVPNNSGSYLIEMSVTTFNNITVNTPADVSGIQIDGTVFPQFNFNAGSGSMTIG